MAGKQQRWKVGELAKLTGLTIRTLRYYDQIGLFSPSAYSESGHRLYQETDLQRLQQILSLKELGLSLHEVKAALTGDHYSPKEIVTLQIRRLKQTIKLQQKLLAELEHVADRMQTSQSLTVEDFTKLLDVMKQKHEKYFIEQRMIWESSLDRLGQFLTIPPKEE